MKWIAAALTATTITTITGNTTPTRTRTDSLTSKHSGLLHQISTVYGVHFATQALPLLTVPYLSRTLGADAWGLVAMAQAFAVYVNVIVDYGFIYSATRSVAAADTRDQVAQTVASVFGAKMLLGIFACGGAAIAYVGLPAFRNHPAVLGAAVLSEVVRAMLPGFYFYGMQRVATFSQLEMCARLAAAAGLFVFVHRPEDAWEVFALNGATAMVTLAIAVWLIQARHPLRIPQLQQAWQIIREGWSMFLFRGTHNVYTLGNAFLLGLFASSETVGFYAGAEKINSAAVGLLAPLSTVLYPKTASLLKTSRSKAARLTTLSLCIMGAAGIGLTVLMWFGAPIIVPLFLGRGFTASVTPFRILSLRSPMVAWINTLGFQWLLALGLEKYFQRATLAALLANLALAIFLVPRFSASGMAGAVVLSQIVVVAGIFLVLKARRLTPFTSVSGAQNG
jgi:PST family polysaccharide transporter